MGFQVLMSTLGFASSGRMHLLFAEIEAASDDILMMVFLLPACSILLQSDRDPIRFCTVQAHICIR